jgi:hypothetical protein
VRAVRWNLIGGFEGGIGLRFDRRKWLERGAIRRPH